MDEAYVMRGGFSQAFSVGLRLKVVSDILRALASERGGERSRHVIWRGARAGLPKPQRVPASSLRTSQSADSILQLHSWLHEFDTRQHGRVQIVNRVHPHRAAA